MEFLRVLNLWAQFWSVSQGVSTEFFSLSDSKFNSLQDSVKKSVARRGAGGGRNDYRLVCYLKILKIFKISQKALKNVQFFLGFLENPKNFLRKS